MRSEWAKRLKAHIENHPIDFGDSQCQTVLERLYQAYAEAGENDPPEIRKAFEDLGSFMEQLPLKDNNELFQLVCELCIAYDRKAYCDGLQTGAKLMMELNR